MRALLLTLPFAVLALGTATDASACRKIQPRPEELAQREAIVATVISSERVEPSDWYGWRIVAEGTFGGEEEGRRSFDFKTRLYFGGCGEIPLPPAGERWVLYLDRADTSEVLDAFPLDDVKDLDARLAGVH
jgi:hypothetical protein